MVNQDWLYRVSAPILAATEAAKLPPEEKQVANGYAWLIAKHKALNVMPVSSAKREFETLDANTQQSLKSLYADAPYLQEDPTFLSKVWDVATAPLEATWNALGSYGESLSNVYRTGVNSGSPAEFFQNWDKNFDGKKVFDRGLEQQVDAYYTPEVAKIAKKISTGMGLGEVLATLSTDEEFAAFQRFTQGDETFQNAIRDYDNAKISWGRSFARMFGLSPDIGAKDQGIEGTVYNLVSGVADATGDILFDPLTFIAAPFKAVQTARMGLMSLARVERGALGVVMSARKAAGLKVGFDAAFDIKSVRKAYDTMGPMIQSFKNADEVGKARIFEDIKKISPDLDFETVRQLSLYENKAKGITGIKDADSALQFFKDTDAMESIMIGKSAGRDQAKLATYTALTEARSRIRQAAKDLAGGKAVASKVSDQEVDDAVRYLINNGQSVHSALRAKEIKSYGDRASRLLEKAFVNRSVYVGGTDDFGRALNANSADTIYALARTFLPRYHARMISNAYASTTDYAASRNIIRGLFDTMADHLGIPESGAIRMRYEKEIDKWANPVYSEETVIDQKLGAYMNMPAGTRYNPAVINGEQKAISGNQVTNMVALPDIAKLARMGQQNMYAKAISKTFTGPLVSSVTDTWSALNLLPRLGIRSVLDESIMQSLTMPLSVLGNLGKGYQRSITERIVGSPDKATKIRFSKKRFDSNGNEITVGVAPFSEEKTIGAIARMTRWLYADVSESERRIANTSDSGKALVFGAQISKAKISHITRMSEEDSVYLMDDIKYGHSNEIRNLGEGVSESMNAGISRDIPSMASHKLSLNTQGILNDLNIKYGNKPTVFDIGDVGLKKKKMDYVGNFFIQLDSRIANNGFVGELAVRNMRNPDAAVKAIANHLKTDGAEYYSRFDRSRYVKAGQRTVEQDALDMYLHVRKLFYSDEGVFNKELYKRVYKNGKVNTDLTLADFDAVMENLPTKLMGFAERDETYANLPSLFSDFVEHGFGVSDRQVATLTREPAYTAYLLHYRRQMKPLQEGFIKQKVAEGWDEAAATEMAAKRYSQLASEAALNRMIGFIDNPNVRSVMALNARNVARYYRANEDFARRVARVVKEPAALVKLRMSMEGLDHTGFIHEDENGDKYFSIPVDEVMYPVYANVLDFFGETPKQMMPLDFTGKLKMLTPSADPESWTPTFAGPLMSFGIGGVAQMLNEFGHPEIADALNRGLLGKYAENKDFIDAITPGVVKRINEVRTATFDPNAVSEQITSAFFKSAAFYTANNMGLDETATLAEREQFKRDMVATARNIVAVRNLLGIWSPVSPTLSETVDIPDHMLANDMTSWRSEFRALVQAEIAKGDPNAYDNALSKWTKLFPGKLVYTVPETELDTVASVKKTKQAVSWIKNNKALVDAHRQGSTFLMPQMNGYDIDAYAFLKREGYIQSKTMDQYLEDIANVNAENEYFDMRDTYNKQIANAPTTQQQQLLAQEFERRLNNFKDKSPYLKLALERNSTGNQLKIDVLNDTRNMLDSTLAPNTAAAQILKRMIREYDMFKSQIDSMSSQSDSVAAYKAQLRAQMSSKMQEIAGINPNAQAFYNTILKRLIEG